MATLWALAAPVAATASIDQVFISNSGAPPTVCVEDATVARLTFTITDPAGNPLEAQTAPPTTGPCPLDTTGSAPASFQPTLQTGAPRFPYGAKLTISGDGAPVAMRLPVAMWNRVGHSVLLERLSPGGVVSGGGVNSVVPASGTVTATVTSDPSLLITNMIGASQVTMSIQPEQQLVEVGRRGSQEVVVFGLDPTRSGSTAVVRGRDGHVVGRYPLYPRVGADEVAGTGVAQPFRVSDSVTVSQPGFFAPRTIRAATAGFSRSGFMVAAPAHETVHYRPFVKFAPARTPGVRCGLTTAGCVLGGGFRSSVRARGFVPAAGDQLGTTAYDISGDSFLVNLVKPGGWGSLDDGSLGIWPNAAGIGSMTISDHGYHQLVRELTRVGRVTQKALPFREHVQSGAVVTFSGSGGFAGLAPYRYRLHVSLKRTVVSGVTYPHAQVHVVHSIISIAYDYYARADAKGRFRIRIHPGLSLGDLVAIGAVDPANGNMISTSTAFGAQHPAIVGVRDRQLVNGTGTLRAGGLQGFATWTSSPPIPASIFHTPGLGHTATVNTSLVRNGTYRIMVIGPTPSMIGYIYLIIRH